MHELDELYGFILNIYHSAKKRGISKLKYREYCSKHFREGKIHDKFTVDQFCKAIEYLEKLGRLA